MYYRYIRRAGHTPPHGPIAGWWVLTTAKARTNDLTCLPKHGGTRDSTFLVNHPMTDQRCLTSAIARRSVLTTGPSSSSKMLTFYTKVKRKLSADVTRTKLIPVLCRYREVYCKNQPIDFFSETNMG
jgi:hypothetical protein